MTTVLVKGLIMMTTRHHLARVKLHQVVSRTSVDTINTMTFMCDFNNKNKGSQVK